jgi:Fur family ferric uptake transcriptional regulator
MLNANTILQQMSQSGYRITRPRRAVVRALAEDEGHLSPAEVYERARAHHANVGLVTVYRTLELLAEMGLVRRIHTDNGCHDYAGATHGHRHPLVCRACGATVEFDGCDLSPLVEKIGRATGYRVDEHLLELVGLCPACQYTVDNP